VHLPVRQHHHLRCRHLGDQEYAAELERIVAQRRWSATAAGSADAWAMESHAAARRALLPPQGAVDEAYYRANIATVDEQLALGGWRLASLVNQALDRAAP